MTRWGNKRLGGINGGIATKAVPFCQGTYQRGLGSWGREGQRFVSTNTVPRVVLVRGTATTALCWWIFASSGWGMVKLRQTRSQMASGSSIIQSRTGTLQHGLYLKLRCHYLSSPSLCPLGVLQRLRGVNKA